MPFFGGYWLSGLISSMAQQNELQTGLAGGEVTLSCTGIPLDSKLSQDVVVSWMYYDTLLWRMENKKGWKSKACNSLPLLPLYGWETSSLLTKPIFSKGPTFITGRADIKTEYKQLRVWNLKLSDAGIYTCKYGSHEVRTSLHIFKCKWVEGF